MTRAQKLSAIPELTALKDCPVGRDNVEVWLQKVKSKLLEHFPDSNHADVITELFGPWVLPHVDAKAKYRLTFKQAVDSAKGTIAQIVSQLQAEAELHSNREHL